ncbi:hypothetical protein L2E82_16479 [Cichorium intybus]|uniref:Uncharacterized protein n=1 Tax=Cichorium intybus TaxID=13427 RepID=A0ACB9F6Z3_CICIN|nr:hypothetical protein L2E82_16479 [Cichorium intybus]
MIATSIFFFKFHRGRNVFNDNFVLNPKPLLWQQEQVNKKSLLKPSVFLSLENHHCNYICLQSIYASTI